MIQFSDSHFIISRQLLTYPEKHWTTLDFSGSHRPIVVGFLNYLIEQEIAHRSRKRGRSSYTVLRKPEKLLEMCILHFRNCEEKSFFFIMQQKQERLLKSLAEAGIEFYLGRFSGIHRELVYSTESTLTLLIPERRLFYGERLDNFQMDFKLLKVGFGGNVQVILPRYKKFLKKFSDQEDGVDKPGDFYTYLYMASSTDIMAQPQKDYMEKNLRGVHGTFLSWR